MSKEVIMKVPSFSADYPKAPIYVADLVRCKDCKHRKNICPMRYTETVGEDERIHDYSTDNGYCSWANAKAVRMNE